MDVTEYTFDEWAHEYKKLNAYKKKIKKGLIKTGVDVGCNPTVTALLVNHGIFEKIIPFLKEITEFDDEIIIKDLELFEKSIIKYYENRNEK